jgi:hypothetical protein
MVPADPPQPIVWTGSPKVSIACSFTIMAVSADVTSLQFCEYTLNVADASA